VVSCSDLCFGVVGVLHSPLHVGLPGAHPHITQQNVLQSDLIFSTDYHVEGTTGLHGLKDNFPGPILVCTNLLFLSVKGYSVVIDCRFSV
jgi:hypothetical protein